MSVHADTSSGVAAQPTEIAHRAPFSTKEIQWAGGGIVMVGVLFLLVAVALGLAFTAPSAGACFPSGGGTSIPCPSSELTPNNLFTLIALAIASVGSLLIGTLLVMSAYFRLNPAA